MLTAAILTIALGLAIFVPILRLLTARGERWLAAACLVATLPMSWAMYHGVRLPLDGWLKATLGEGDGLGWIRTAYAPLTEEPAKLWPLLLPWVRRGITRENVGRMALALGVGFALGEVVLVAQLIAVHQPDVAKMPWYLLGGFIWERLATCVVHSGMTALALTLWRRRSQPLLGLLLAMLAHYLVNFPISMSRWGWLGSNKTLAMLLLSGWVGLAFLLALAGLAWLQYGRSRFGALFYGSAVCPGCRQPYERSLWGLNLGPSRRYEKCPHCRKWHWTERAPAPVTAKENGTYRY
jgi:hypothetical protein